MLEAFAVAADDAGLIARADFLDVIAGLRIDESFRVTAEEAPGVTRSRSPSAPP